MNQKITGTNDTEVHDTHNATRFRCDIASGIGWHTRREFAAKIASAEYFNIIFCDKMNRRRLTG